jgi:hypothetical protein
LSGAALLLAGASACTTGSTGTQHSSAPRTHSTTPTVATTTPTNGTGPATDTGGSTPPAQTSSGAPASGGPSGGDGATGSAKKTVPVQITIYDWNTKLGRAEVDAFVPGAVISGGTCTLTMTNGATSRTASHSAVTTPSSTSCGLMSIPRAQLSAGTWQAVVRFHATNAAGRSDAVSIQVPA